MAASRKRLTKKEMKHDPVMESALSAWSYTMRNRNRVLGVVMGLILVAVVGIGVFSYRGSKIGDAETKLGRALLFLETGQHDSAVELLEELVSDRGSGDFGKTAVYFLGQVRFEDGEYEESKDLFARYLRSGTNDVLLKVSAAKGVADCLVELGEDKEAGTLYLDAAERFSETPLAADCLFLAGLVLDRAGDRVRAIHALDKLIQDFPKYARAGKATVLLGELKARDRILSTSEPLTREG